MTNEERIIAMLERIHHENCFILKAMTDMTTHDDEIKNKIRDITDAWDFNFEAIMKGDK